MGQLRSCIDHVDYVNHIGSKPAFNTKNLIVSKQNCPELELSFKVDVDYVDYILLDVDADVDAPSRGRRRRARASRSAPATPGSARRPPSGLGFAHIVQLRSNVFGKQGDHWWSPGIER
jgi:hypothetical protein